MTFKRDGQKPELIIRDDGIRYVVGSGNGFGSRLAPALAREANVELVLESSPGQGSVATVRVP